ncbi:hypothetical protein TNCV_3836821 [Trichonephila clavipes]|nr:hypothetical protein TNCV_3836821 [Trichonephila clavipes]
MGLGKIHPLWEVFEITTSSRLEGLTEELRGIPYVLEFLSRILPAVTDIQTISSIEGTEVSYAKIFLLLNFVSHADNLKKI